MEALACFTTLLVNVPAWISDLESITQDATQRQTELVAANEPSESTIEHVRIGPWSDTAQDQKPRYESIPLGAETLSPEHAQLQTPHLTNADALRLAQRKRKTASVCSGDMSGPSKIRAKSKAVVYFDGTAQGRFEKLVRAVGSSRNSIRKGKMSARVDSLARTGSSSSDESYKSRGEDDEFRILNDPKHTRPARSSFGLAHGAEAFDLIDGRLDKAQALCERAAHQMLRDGECMLELKLAKEQFTEAIKLAEAELPAMRKRAEKSEARRRRSEEWRRSEERRRVEEDDEAAEQQLQISHDVQPRVFGVLAAAYLPTENVLEVDDLEADDDATDDEGDFVLSALPVGKYGQMRSPRILAGQYRPGVA